MDCTNICLKGSFRQSFSRRVVKIAKSGVPEHHAFQKEYGNLVDILQCNNLYRYFVSEGIITMREHDELNYEANPIEKIKKFLGKVSSSLNTGYTKSFHKMLDVMHTHGNEATRDLARNIMLLCGLNPVDDLPAPSVRSDLIDTAEEASLEFTAVVADVAGELEKCDNKDINKVKTVCYNLKTPNGKPVLSSDDKEKIKTSNSMFDIFEVIDPHWRWNSHRLLFLIIKRVQSPTALELLEKFRRKINYQIKIKDIYKHFQHSKQPVPIGYTRMEAIIDKDYSDISLEEFSELEKFVDQHLGIIQCPIEVNQSKSIEVVWLVSIKAVDSLCSIVFKYKETLLCKSFKSLKIGGIDILNATSQPLLEIDKDGKCKVRQPAEVYDATRMSADLQVTSVDQFQDITSKDLKRLEDRIAGLVLDKQDHLGTGNTIEQIKDSPVPFITWNGAIIGYLLCLIISSHGGKYNTVEAVAMENPMPQTTSITVTQNDVDIIKHYVHKDPLKELVQSLEDEPNSQQSKLYYLEAIENFFRKCTKAGVMIYYTGYAEEGTGNWCFEDGTISFQEVFELYKKYLTTKLLHIFSDCCYSGQWVVDCSKCLDEMGIGACGHALREKGILIKISASCQPSQKATVGIFSSKGIFYDDDNNSMFIYSNKELSKTQTTFGGNFAKIKCLQLQGPTAPCRLPDIPPRCSWKWVDVIAIDFKDRPSSLIYTIRGKVQGKEAWQCVLVEKELVDKFKAELSTGIINASRFGYIISSGRGNMPPDNIAKNIKIYSPDYVNYF